MNQLTAIDPEKIQSSKRNMYVVLVWKCHGHSDDILSNPLILIWQTSLEEPEPPSIPLVFFLLNPQFLGVKPLRKSLGSVPFITFFAWKLPWSSGEAGICIPLKLIAKATENRPSKRVNHRIPTIDFQVRSGCWFQVSGKFQGSKSDDC